MTNRIIMISGPVGAGKSTVAKQLVGLLSGNVSHIEGDKFWTFFAKSDSIEDPRENFKIMMRSITAAALPFAKLGYTVVLDFSFTPRFVEAARRIVKDIPLDFVMLLPRVDVCIERAANRDEGRVEDYSEYLNFYSLFTGFDRHTIDSETASPQEIAMEIIAGLNSDRFAVDSMG